MTDLILKETKLILKPKTVMANNNISLLTASTQRNPGLLRTMIKSYTFMKYYLWIRIGF
jgi:hypothetical protein